MRCCSRNESIPNGLATVFQSVRGKILFTLCFSTLSTTAFAWDFAKVSAVSSASIACQNSGTLSITMNRNFNLFSLLTGWLPTNQFQYRLNLPAGLNLVSPQTKATGMSSFTSNFTAEYLDVSGALAGFINSGNVAFNVTGIKAGSWSINAASFTNKVNLSSVTANATITVGTCPTPILSGTLTAPASAALDSSYNYTVSIKNTGIATVGNTTLTGTLPDGLSFVSGSSPSGFACTTGAQVVTCNQTSVIPQDGTDTVTLVVKPTAAGTYNFNMNLSGEGAATAATNTVATTVSSIPDLSVSVAQPAPALVEAALSEIPVTVTNLGSMEANAPISLSFTLPTNMSSPLKFARNADAWVCLTSDTIVTCTYNKSLAAGAISTIRIPVVSAANTAGSMPSPFGASVAQAPGEVNLSNNTAPAMVPATAVAKLTLTSIVDPLYSQPILNPTTIPKYALPLPNALASFFQHTPNTTTYPGTDFYTLDIKQIRTHILPPGFPATDVFAYGDPARPNTFSYPAHTIMARSTDPASNTSGLGKAVKVQYKNTLAATKHLLPIDRSIHGANANEPDIRSVAHLHGIKSINQNSDGYPEAWYSPNGQTGGQFSMTSPTVDYNANPFDYLNNQEGTMLWYHDHTLGMTRLNVYAGLAGLYMLRDDNEMAKIAANQLPSGPYEIPLVLQDRMFHTDGSLAYPDVDLNGNAATPSMVPEFYGTVMLVNGTAWPYLEVEPRKYRFRVLNGSSSRFYTLTLSNNANFQVIGTEGGFLNAPVTVNKLSMGSAERYDIIVDFSTAAGQSITLTNSANSPYPNGTPVVTGLDDQIMQFRVNQPLSTTADASIPNSLRSVAIPTLTPSTGTQVRQVLLSESVDNNGRILPILGTVADGILGWMDTVTEMPKAGTTERWEIFNDTVDAHPIHLHGGHFQVLNRQDFAAVTGVNGSLTNITYPNVVAALNPVENTWKDTVISYPGQVTRITVKFEDKGQFVWHCHILEHEDHDMMRPMQVQ